MQKEAGKETHANQHTASNVQLKQQIAEAADHPQKPNKTSAELAADATGANKEYVQQIKKIEKVAPERLKDIEEGIQATYRIANGKAYIYLLEQLRAAVATSDRHSVTVAMLDRLIRYT